MLLGYHLTWSVYGFWLPNDPRGSWSEEVWAKYLKPFGNATKVNVRDSQASSRHDYQARLFAQKSLKYPCVKLDLHQRECVGIAFGHEAESLGCRIFALAVMEDHVHVVVDALMENPLTLIQRFKSAATRALAKAAIHPLRGYQTNRGQTPTPWSKGGWRVYIQTIRQMSQAIDYVRMNPCRNGEALQDWPFIHAFHE